MKYDWEKKTAQQVSWKYRADKLMNELMNE